MEMPKPSDAHKKLLKLVGRWNGEEKLYPSPWDPTGGMAKGLAVNKAELDGFFVVQDYQQERNGRINFRGHGVFGWDQFENCYVVHWFDSMGTPPQVMKGTFENSVLSLVGKFPQGFNRGIWDYSKEGKVTFKMEVSMDGKNWQPMMEGNYTKER
ncbi:MAG TPA: DUF1579 family protein [Bacteroidota bacterium]|nr:DUF1579 family protein [Bacteroidota bacterium]